MADVCSRGTFNVLAPHVPTTLVEQILQWFRPGIIVILEDFRLAGRDLARAVTARAKGGEYSSLHQPWAARPENSINAGCRLS
jgi:hypothetical protein